MNDMNSAKWNKSMPDSVCTTCYYCQRYDLSGGTEYWCNIYNEKPYLDKTGVCLNNDHKFFEERSKYMTEFNPPKGSFQVYECSCCRKQEISESWSGPAPIPKGWKGFEYADSPDKDGNKLYIGFVCSDCWKEMNKPFSYSITINGELVQPPKTITLQNRLHNLAEGRYMRYHVDYSKVFKLFEVQCIQRIRQDAKELDITCTIIPKDAEQCYEAYKFLTTTEDIEYYTERYNAERFIKAYAKGTFSGGYFS